MERVLIVCTTDSMILNFLVPHIKHMEANGIYVECACSKTGMFYSELENIYKIKINEIPFERSPYKLKNIKALTLLSSLIKKNHYDTVFCHEPVGGIAGRIAGIISGCKVIYMAHGFHFYKGAPIINWLVYYNVEKFFSRFTDLLITINKEDYEISKKFKSRRNVLINGIGVDIKRFHKYETNYLRKEYKLEDDSLVLLSVGELISRKNHETVINAISNIKLKDKIHYFIAGDGPLEMSLSQKVNDMKLNDNIHFLGFCKNIPELVNSCDVFLFPSIHEGLSMALMEAMAAGKPVISSKIRGNIDLIENMKGGILVSTFDVNGYIEAIITMMNDSNIRTEFGEYNLNKVKNFDIKVVQEQLYCELKNI